MDRTFCEAHANKTPIHKPNTQRLTPAIIPFIITSLRIWLGVVRRSSKFIAPKHFAFTCEQSSGSRNNRRLYDLTTPIWYVVIEFSTYSCSSSCNSNIRDVRSPIVFFPVPFVSDFCRNDYSRRISLVGVPVSCGVNFTED